MKRIIQKIKITNVALVVASLLAIYGIYIFISHITTSAQCLSLGFIESKITWNFKKYCISPTGRVEPFENLKKYLPRKGVSLENKVNKYSAPQQAGDNIGQGIQQGVVDRWVQSLINAFFDAQRVVRGIVGAFRSFWQGLSGQ